MMTTIAEDNAVPQSVERLWHEAQISHSGIPAATEMLESIWRGGGDGTARIALGLAIQELGKAELVDLMIERVIDGRGLHSLLTGLDATGHIRRRDLVEWSKMFA